MKKIIAIFLTLGCLNCLGQRFVQSTPNVNSLVNLNVLNVHSNIMVLGYSTPGDGLGGMFFPTNTLSGTNLNDLIASVSNPTWSWKRLSFDIPLLTGDAAIFKGAIGNVSGVVRPDAAVELHSANGVNSVLLSIYQTNTPVVGSTEAGIVFMGKNAAGTAMHMGSISSVWADTTDVTGYPVTRISQVWSNAAYEDTPIRVFGNHGVAIFGTGDAAAYAPGFHRLFVQGQSEIRYDHTQASMMSDETLRIGNQKGAGNWTTIHLAGSAGDSFIGALDSGVAATKRIALSATATAEDFAVYGDGNILITGQGTGYQQMRILNNGGEALLGINGSTPGAILVRSLAYATCIGTRNDSALHLGTWLTNRMTIDPTGNITLGDTNSPTLVIVQNDHTQADLFSGETLQIRNTEGSGNWSTIHFRGALSDGFLGFADYAAANNKHIALSANGTVETLKVSGDNIVTVTGTESIVGAGQSMTMSGSGTSENYHRFTSTGGDAAIGVESSTGGSLLAGGLPYATVLSSVGSTAVQIGTAATPRLTVQSDGIVSVTSGYLRLPSKTVTPTGAEIGAGGAIYWCSNAVAYISVSTDGSAVTTKQICP